MKARRRLLPATLAGAFLLVSGVAAAEEPSNGARQEQKQTVKKKVDNTKAAADKKKADAKKEAKDAKEDSPPNKDESAAEQVKEGAQEGETKANEANKSVVGEETQNDNEQRAQHPPPKDHGNKEAKEAAAEIGKTTTTAAETIAVAVQDTTQVMDKPGSYKPFALEINPLGLVVGGRLSLQAEWAPTTHHVLLVNPQFQSTSAEVVIGENQRETQRFTGVGGELGYRYYTGHRGMNGVFVGPSVLGGVYNAGLPGDDKSFTNVGVAADVGLQQIFWDHLVLGGGVGIQYNSVSYDFGDLPSGPSQIAESGVKPRLLFQGGYAF